MADAAGTLLAERSCIIASAAPSAAAARALSDATDRAVSALAETALARLSVPWCLLALGGWGAGRLLPYSDLDLLVVTDARPDALNPALQAMLYPLWDAGLKIGHQVRTRRDHLRSCRADLVTLTATMTGRSLAGDGELAGRVLAEVADAAKRRSRAVTRELSLRSRPGSPYLLEPDLKEGAGGQRDLDEIAWTATLLSGAPATSHGFLAKAGVLDASEVARLDAAGDAITAARWAVHAQAPRATNLWTLETAAASGLDGEAVQAALADTHHLLLRVRNRTSSRTPVAERRVPWSAGHVFDAVGRGEAALPDLEEAAWAGLLDDLVPALGELMHVRRPGLGHLYTVGAHSLRCAALAGSVAARMGIDDTHGRMLTVAALLHDVGKAQRGAGHAERGARAVETLGSRFGLDAQQTRDAMTLVAEHLLMPETVTSQDIHDEDVILRAAARVGSPRLVAPLLALTEADSRSTGPGTWTPWHAALLGELAGRLDVALGDESEGAGVAEAGERTRTAVLEAAGRRGGGDAVARFAQGATLRYLAAHAPDQVVAHAMLADGVSSSGSAVPVETLVSPGPAEGTWRVVIAARDRAGLFATVCGALAVRGLDIVTADAYEAPDGIVLDVFVVRPDTRATADPGTWAEFERTLRAGLADPRALAVRLDERRRDYRPARDAGVVPRVAVQPTETYDTALRVVAADRIGLLHDVAGAITASDLQIHRVRATSRGGVVTDTFHVTDAAGEPLSDPGEIGHLIMRVRARL